MKQRFFSILVPLVLFAAPPGAAQTVRVSLGSAETQADWESYWPSLSSDGRFVAFFVFVHDLARGTTIRASLNSSGAAELRGGAYPALSHDGRFVAFASEARELVPGDANRTWDVFVRDLVAGTTERVSVATGGAEANNASSYPAISADGRFVAFQSLATILMPGDTNVAWDVFVHDRMSSTTVPCTLTSKGMLANNSSLSAAISGDGSRVVFKSTATNLVEGDLNMQQDVFVRDLVKGTTERASVASDGSEPHDFSSQPTISADGEKVGSYCVAANVVPLDTNDEPDLFVRTLTRIRRR